MRGHKEKKRQPPFPLPHALVLLSTPDGWRQSLIDVRGGMTCGALPDVPADADPREARAAAARMVRELTRTFHETDVEVVWEPVHGDRSWTAQVRVPGDAEKASRPWAVAP
ncbi:hypothetical protein ACF07V_00620 [Streptomyces sp. NPDC015661]|uniref:hypothetical protein n=1 Tax=Streptomyces sp. NPDC015661 TaxID=3364961 RepID=UPI003700D549